MIRTPQPNPLRITLWSVAAALLALPLVAMRFTREVQWSAGDFLAFGALLAAMLSGYEYLARRHGDRRYRAAAGLALSGALMLLWANLAVGVIGGVDNPRNAMFPALLALGTAVAVGVRFAAYPMAQLLMAMSGALILIGVIAASAGYGESLPPLLVLAMWWLAAAALFRRSARHAG